MSQVQASPTQANTTQASPRQAGPAPSRAYGVMLVAASAVLWSTAGLFVRMAAMDTWSIVAWRSGFAGVTLAVIALAQDRVGALRSLARFDRWAAVSVAASVVCTISYVLALRLTTVANVMTIYAALPFVATALAYVWLGERVSRRFLVAAGLALAGMAVMAGAVASPRDLAGVAAALVMTASFAAQLVFIKRHPGLNMAVISALAAVACVAITAPLAQHGVPAPRSLLACALFGVLTSGVAYVLILNGGRILPAGEAGFISLLDVVLGPFWVWLFYAERPGMAVLAGGAVVLGAVGWYLASERAGVVRTAPKASGAGR